MLRYQASKVSARIQVSRSFASSTWAQSKRRNRRQRAGYLPTRCTHPCRVPVKSRIRRKGPVGLLQLQAVTRRKTSRNRPTCLLPLIRPSARRGLLLKFLRRKSRSIKPSSKTLPHSSASERDHLLISPRDALISVQTTARTTMGSFHRLRSAHLRSLLTKTRMLVTVSLLMTTMGSRVA